MLNDKIKQLRTERHLTQGNLAEALDVSQSTVASWENGSRKPSLDLIPVIAAFFGVKVDVLIGSDDQDQADAIENEAMAIRERYRRDPDFRLLFSAAHNAKPDHLRAAAAMLKALEPGDDDD